jgi:hypothetical protein
LLLKLHKLEFRVDNRLAILDVDVERSRGDGCELERSAASGDERNRPQRRLCDDNPSTAQCTDAPRCVLSSARARTTEDLDVKRSRGDGCESERSAASGDERNRPQRRPRDDIYKTVDRKDKEDIKARRKHRNFLSSLSSLSFLSFSVYIPLRRRRRPCDAPGIRPFEYRVCQPI